MWEATKPSKNNATGKFRGIVRAPGVTDDEPDVVTYIASGTMTGREYDTEDKAFAEAVLVAEKWNAADEVRVRESRQKMKCDQCGAEPAEHEMADGSRLCSGCLSACMDM
jgi:hypothetical protein